MGDKMVICYTGNGCNLVMKGYCLFKGFKVMERRLQKCDDYHERGKYD